MIICCWWYFFHRNISSRKIGKFHPEMFPFIILPNDAGNTGIHLSPGFGHLIHIPMIIQLFRRIYADHIASFSADFNIQNAWHILTKIIDFSGRCIFVRHNRTHELSFIPFDNLHRRQKLLFQFPFRHIFCGYRQRIFPCTVIKTDCVPARLFQSMVYCLWTINITHHHRIFRRFAVFICTDDFHGSVFIGNRQFCRKYETFSVRFIGIGIWRHKNRERKGIMFIHFDIPSISYFRTQHIFSLLQIVPYIKYHILDQLMIICPGRIQFVIIHLFPIQIKQELSQTAHPGLSWLYGFSYSECFPDIKRCCCSICHPFFKHVFLTFLFIVSCAFSDQSQTYRRSKEAFRCLHFFLSRWEKYTILLPCRTVEMLTLKMAYHDIFHVSRSFFDHYCSLPPVNNNVWYA